MFLDPSLDYQTLDFEFWVYSLVEDKSGPVFRPTQLREPLFRVCCIIDFPSSNVQHKPISEVNKWDSKTKVVIFVPAIYTTARMIAWLEMKEAVSICSFLHQTRFLPATKNYVTVAETKEASCQVCTCSDEQMVQVQKPNNLRKENLNETETNKK